MDIVGLLSDDNRIDKKIIDLFYKVYALFLYVDKFSLMVPQSLIDFI